MRALRILLVLLALGLATPCQAQPTPLQGDFVLGDAAAPVTVSGYLSPTCPACRAWHATVFPLLAAKYIAAGKVRFVVKETPSHNKALDAAVFGLARCAGAGGYLAVIERAFESQTRIAEAARSPEGAMPELVALGRSAGISEAEIPSCINSLAAAEHRAAVRKEAIARGVSGTPTFFVGDIEASTTVAMDPSRFFALIDSALERGT